MSVSARIYTAGSFLFGGQPIVDDLTNAGYSAVILWAVHVSPTGDLKLNNTPLVTGGVYQSDALGDLADRLAQLKRNGLQILFCVGEDSQSHGDYYNIYNLLAAGPDSKSYQTLANNFSALFQAMSAAGADIDAIDMDNEDYYENDVIVLFADLLQAAGCPSVTFCPFENLPFWQGALQDLTNKYGDSFVGAVHLQCYTGGRPNQPSQWGKMIADASSNALLIPGLASIQAKPGPWWDKASNKMGGSVVVTPGVAMYGDADWSKLLRVENYQKPEEALQAAKSGETFFFHCKEAVGLGQRLFQKGDTAFFAGEPQWGTAPQCDAYSLSQGCGNLANPADVGACPAGLQKQFASWKGDRYPPQGGFIWLYDGIVNCLLAGCCGGTEKAPAATATAYRQAITDGLS